MKETINYILFILETDIVNDWKKIKTTITYFCTSSEPITLINVASVLFATARAHKVLPVPGGPYNSTPLGGSIPKFTNRSG